MTLHGISLISEKAGTAKTTVNNNESNTFFIISPNETR